MWNRVHISYGNKDKDWIEIGQRERLNFFIRNVLVKIFYDANH